MHAVGGYQGKSLIKQMVLNLIIFTLIACAIYVFIISGNQLPASTSAIGQVWSGNCRMGCRRSGSSGVSGLGGLGGLTPGASEDSNGFYLNRARCEDPINCVCANCPCKLVESFLRTCQPATSLYSTVVQAFAGVYYTSIEMLTAFYNYLVTVLSCRTSCQRRPQLVETKRLGSNTILFEKKHTGTTEKRDLPKKSDSNELRLSKSITFKDKTDAKDEGPGRSLANKPKKEVEEEKSVTSGSSNDCSKCIEQNKICLKNCPRANKKKK